MKIRFDKIKKTVKIVPMSLGRRPFLTFLALLIVTFIFNGFIFYKYSIVAQRTGPEVTEKLIEFEYQRYQNILNVWRENNQKFAETDIKEYPVLFQSAPSIINNIPNSGEDSATTSEGLTE